MLGGGVVEDDWAVQQKIILHPGRLGGAEHCASSVGKLKGDF